MFAKTRKANYFRKPFSNKMLLILTIGLSTQLFGRDGTLPIQLEGTLVSVPSTNTIATNVNFHEDIESPAIAVPCSLKGALISSDVASGEIQVGADSYEIIGTCKDKNRDLYEVVAKGQGKMLNFVGKVSGDEESVQYKGVVNVTKNNSQQKLKFELSQ